MAYLVDAETGELHAGRLTDGQRDHDLAIASENIAGGLYDLIEAGRLPPGTDPGEILAAARRIYDDLWAEVTREEVFAADERFRLEERVRRLNALGFDVDEIAFSRTTGTDRFRIQPRVVEEGHHARRLERVTGMRVQENQARALLNDIDCFAAWIDRQTGTLPSEIEAAHRWMTEAFRPAMEATPAPLRARREPVELFLQMLEHRWYLSERAGHEVSNQEAIESMVHDVLPELSEERLTGDPGTGELPITRSR